LLLNATRLSRAMAFALSHISVGVIQSCFPTIAQ
jgi:hypothetical protein